MPETQSLTSLIEKVRAYSPEADFVSVQRAYHFSREAHCSQKRSEGSPYINHPLAVAYILADMKMDTLSIAAGLLHDTVEDAEVSLEDVRTLFGRDVAFIVKGLTKLSKVEFRNKQEAQAHEGGGGQPPQYKPGFAAPRSPVCCHPSRGGARMMKRPDSSPEG